MYIYFQTFGCKVNQYETAAVADLFDRDRFTVTDDPFLCDVCIINSCCVTAESVSKMRQFLRRMRRLCPDAVIAVTGCAPQGEPDISLPEADIVTGTKNRAALPALVDSFLSDRRNVTDISPYNGSEIFEPLRCAADKGHTRAFLKIQDGCSRFCSYCIIPYTRGRIRSKSPDMLRDDVSALSSAGYSEIVLTGINLGFYGREYGISIADAVNICAGSENIQRIRLGSLEPELLSDPVLEKLAAQPKLCPSFHLSLQSGCEKTLRSMNRKYTPDEYKHTVEKVRDMFPECSVTTDIMTGFPGETEEDFGESAAFAESIGFSDIHVFPYSVRKGTKAALMPCQVDGGEKHRRAAVISQIAKRSREKFLDGQLGKTFPVLFEREKSDGSCGGYTPNYTFIKILTKNSKKHLRNLVFYVTIDRIEENMCYGSFADI